MVLALSMAEKIALVGREGKQFLALCRALQKQAANNGLKPSYIGEIARVLERLLEVNLVGYAQLPPLQAARAIADMLRGVTHKSLIRFSKDLAKVPSTQSMVVADPRQEGWVFMTSLLEDRTTAEKAESAIKRPLTDLLKQITALRVT